VNAVRVRVSERLAAFADGPRPVRLAALFVAALSCAFLLEWAAHAVLPVETERGVIVASSRELATGRRDTDEYTITAVLDGGKAVDLGGRNAVGVYDGVTGGLPVLVTRTRADGDVLGVRTPAEYVDTYNYGGAWILCGFAVVGLVGGLTLGRRALRRDGWTVAAFVVPTVAFSVWLWTGPEPAPATSLPDGMGIFAAELPSRVAALGEPARVSGVTVTVPAAPTPGLPASADPALAGFESFTVPLTTSAEEAHYLRMELIGDGAGRAALLDHPSPACGGAPGALGDEVPAGTADLVLCAVVPTGFEPRYLVLGTAGPEQTALELR
jgi:hypothetical protein